MYVNTLFLRNNPSLQLQHALHKNGFAYTEIYTSIDTSRKKGRRAREKHLSVIRFICFLAARHGEQGVWRAPNSAFVWVHDVGSMFICVYESAIVRRRFCGAA